MSSEKKEHKEKKHWHEYAVWVIVVVLSLSTGVLIYLSTFKAIAFDESFYEDKFVEFNIRSQFNSSVNLTAENRALLEYLKEGEGEIQGGFFNTKEKTHLVEVRDLYKAVFKAVDILVLLSMISVVVFMYFVHMCCARRHTHEEREFLKKTLSNLLFGIGITVFAVFAFFLFVILTFDSSFISFHELFFKTDTWMLDPATDNLIRMFPQEFFQDIFSSIVSHSLLYGCVLLVIGGAIRFWKREKKQKQ